MIYYYYLNEMKNDLEFTKLMNALEIKYTKQIINLFDKKYIFVSVIDEKKDFFQKIIIAGIFKFYIGAINDILV